MSDQKSPKLTEAEIERLTQLQILEYTKTNRTGPDTAFSLDGQPVSGESAKTRSATLAKDYANIASGRKEPARFERSPDT